jgi:hypothetical protein
MHNRRDSLLAFEYTPTPVKDSDFNENERLLIVEVARRLEPRLGDIIHAWTEAIPLSAPTEKIPGMRRTLVVLAREFMMAFFTVYRPGNHNKPWRRSENFASD